MPTIKRKVEMNLPQLIEWIWNNDFRDKVFYSQEDESWLRVDDYGDVVDVYNIESTDRFTVEIEEEIDKNTKFHRLIKIESSDEEIFRNRSINSLVNGVTKEFHAYIDGEFKLIWRDGKLVE